MVWGDKKEDGDVPRERTEERPESLSKPPPPKKLPADLQKILDRDDSFFDQLYDG